MEKLRPRGSDDLRCPYCHDDDFTTEPSLRCAGCRAWQHEACYRDELKCGACGRLAGPHPEQSDLIANDRRFVEQLVNVTKEDEGQINVEALYDDPEGARRLMEKLVAGGAACYYDQVNQTILWRRDTRQAAQEATDRIRAGADGLRQVAARLQRDRQAAAVLQRDIKSQRVVADAMVRARDEDFERQRDLHLARAGEAEVRRRLVEILIVCAIFIIGFAIATGLGAFDDA